ncbi:MAG: penicillin-binding protein 1A [Bauldia sp.]
MFLRFIGYLFGIGTVFLLALAAGAAWYVSGLVKDVPDYDALLRYEPPEMTRVHAADGELIAEFARERRLYLPIESIPERVKQAFVAAEDKNFYSHSGLDYVGIGRAVLTDVAYLGSGRRLVGASTITQQVARGFFLTPDQNFSRKIKEMILAVRIEHVLNKQKILELYLNDIFLGLGSYGIASAALTYFDKSVHELTLAEVAYLAALPKGPNNYNPFKGQSYVDRAIDRRNYVIDRMVEDGYATAEEGEAAKAAPLGAKTRKERAPVFTAKAFDPPYLNYFKTAYPEQLRDTDGIAVDTANYFTEEVRRQLYDMYGEQKLYTGGLSVRTSLQPQMQILARRVLMNGLLAYDMQKGYHGPVKHLDLPPGTEWGKAVGEVPKLTDLREWRLAIVTGVTKDAAQIGLQPARDAGGRLTATRETGTIAFGEMKWARWNTGPKAGRGVSQPSDVVSVGDVIYVEALPGTTGQFRLRQVPEINGAILAMSPKTGRVLAMVGGFSFDESQFNRATQAMRQPGSSFKPFVYSAALDNGYTPSSVVMDAPIEIDQGPGLPPWVPENYANDFLGPSTLRTGIELSRNVMTVRLAKDMGMPLVVEYARRFGVYDHLDPLLSMALGAGETTVMKMVTGYATIANGGRKITPTLIDRVQDRYGKTIFQADARQCQQCTATDWANQAEPTIIDERDQVLDPMTAYQITSMMQGVIQRGTATVLKAVGKPIAGKTGTTNDYHDAWFVGFTPDLVVGVYLGYDKPRSLGTGNTGGIIAAPIFGEFMKVALADKAPIPFKVPPGMTMLPIDRRTGLRANTSEGADVILESYKPGTGPPDSYSIIGAVDGRGRPLTVAPDADRAVAGGLGGLY